MVDVEADHLAGGIEVHVQPPDYLAGLCTRSRLEQPDTNGPPELTGLTGVRRDSRFLFPQTGVHAYFPGTVDVLDG